MNKTAQSRSIVDRLHEWGNLAGKAQEKLFNPEFERVMDNLRQIDGDIRSIIAGKSIDNGDPGSDEMSMKDILKEARKNFNRREYMTAVAYLGRFHKKANDLINKIDKLHVDVNQVHQDFLFKELDQEHKDYLRELRNRFANQVIRERLFVEAGVKDLLVNVFSDRGRALAAWERKYPKQTKKLKKDTETMLNKSDDLLKNILLSLKHMGSFRAARKPDPYLNEGNKIKSLFDKYHSLFANYYTDNVKGFLDNQEFANPPSEKQPSEKSISETPSETIPPVPSSWISSQTSADTITPAPQGQRIPVTVVSPSYESEVPPEANAPTQPAQLYEQVITENIGSPAIPKEKPKLSEIPNERQSSEMPSDFDEFMKMEEEAPETKLSNADKLFLKQLIILSDESPLVLANKIKKYANSVNDENKSILLNKLYNKIMEV